VTTVDEAFIGAFHGLLDQADGSSGVELSTAMEHLRVLGFDRPTISTLMKAQILDGHVELTADRRLMRTP